ncbi:olfactory receptor 6C4-like [Centroberyx affinis]|uniref:olfactory receptor 6C4-like n=1 Tax=Centroberyx affinis TaxID=166261 RepID=UPI003A5C3FA4
MDLFNSALGKNITFVHPAYFIISGFTGIPNMKYYYVFLFFVYIVSVLGNTVVMAVIYLDHNLKTPKYIAVFNLAFVDLFGNSSLVPKVLDTFLFGHQHISYNNCLAYFFFCYVCFTMQSLNLVLLSYDRLVAITYPLHYQVLVTHRLMFSMVAFFWVFTIIVMLIAAGLLTRLSFCESLVINSYFCDHGQIFRLACNDYTPSFVISYLLPATILWLPLLFVLISYSYIGRALAKIATARDRLKAFKTCTAHLLLVGIYYLPFIITFALGREIHPNARIINLSLSSVLPPMLNPIIYVLQTQEIKESVKKLLKIRRQSKITLKK